MNNITLSIAEVLAATNEFLRRSQFIYIPRRGKITHGSISANRHNFTHIVLRTTYLDANVKVCYPYMPSTDTKFFQVDLNDIDQPLEFITRQWEGINPDRVSSGVRILLYARKEGILTTGHGVYKHVIIKDNNVQKNNLGWRSTMFGYESTLERRIINFYKEHKILPQISDILKWERRTNESMQKI